MENFLKMVKQASTFNREVTVCMIYRLKVHIVICNLDKNVSNSKIHILPIYEQTDLKTAIVCMVKIVECGCLSSKHGIPYIDGMEKVI